VPPAPAAEAGLYRIAYEHGLRTLDEQRDELNGVRARAGQFVAFTGSATAFLVGAGLQSPTRDGFFYAFAGLGTSLVLVSLICLVVVLGPRWKFALTMDPGTLVDKWIDRQVPARPSEADLLRALAKRISRMIDDNEKPLGLIRSWYLSTVASGTLALLTWTFLVWMRA